MKGKRQRLTNKEKLCNKMHKEKEESLSRLKEKEDANNVTIIDGVKYYRKLKKL